MVKRGWFMEPYRHYLAAKGVRTRRYDMDFGRLKSGLASGMQSTFAHPGDEEARMLRLRTKDEVREREFRKFDAAVESGDIRPEKKEEYVKEKFGPLADKFIKDQLTEGQFREEVANATDYFLQANASRLHIL